MVKRVLIAEDESNIVESLRFVLSREGYEVSHALDGAEALSVARRERPDVLVLDLMLPKLSGFDVLKELRAEDGTKTLPVLMLTAKGQAHDRQAAEGLGVDAFMTKPFSNADVVAEIARITGSHD
jgi:DNA-binding response OmpR family regulator